MTAEQSIADRARALGAEIITGLGQFRAGHRRHVTDWCNSEEEAYRRFLQLVEGEKVKSIELLLLSDTIKNTCGATVWREFIAECEKRFGCAPYSIEARNIVPDRDFVDDWLAEVSLYASANSGAD